MLNAENELKKWAPVLDHSDAPPITDKYKKAVTAKLLENTEIALRQEAAQASFLTEAGSSTGSIVSPDPVLISLVRRAMPNLIAFDVAGVQPMSGPTGLIFAMKPRYKDTTTGHIDTTDTEAFKDEPDTDFSGAGTDAGSLIDVDAYPTTGTGMDTNTGEIAGAAGPALAEMGFTIEKSVVEAKTRQLKAEYTMELAQDLKAVHGLDAESELANILSGEILAEINREVIREIVTTGKAFQGAALAAGKFDLAVDADGRWLQEKFQSLIFHIEQAANKIALETRRGKGNFLICSSNVASALAAAGKLVFGGDGQLNVDSVGNTFAGTLNGRMKVYVDPYAGNDYATVGYKGASPYDAGLFYCPYVPLTMVRAVGENDFQPKIAFKTRYGLVANPLSAANLADASNPYFQTFNVNNINNESS